MGPAEVLLLLSLIYLAAAQQEVVVKLQEDVTLQCLNPSEESISVLKWSRPDLNTYGYVYFYRNKRSYENYQHPSFHGRVKLREADMKGGDASLILRNVSFSDTGIYECHISSRNLKRSRRAGSEISHFISLSVTASDETHLSKQGLDVAGGEADGDMLGEGRVESSSDVMFVAVGAVVVVVVVLVVVGALMAFRSFIGRKKQKPAEHQSKAENQQLV